MLRDHLEEDPEFDDAFKGFDEDGDGELTKEEVRQTLKELMQTNGEKEAWDENEFDNMFQNFEDDGGNEDPDRIDNVPSPKKESGMDKGELEKMIKYITGL